MPIAERRILGRRRFADNESFWIEPAGIRPDLRCWLVSSELGGAETLLPDGFQGVLAKPFTRAELRSCLASMWDGTPAVHD